MGKINLRLLEIVFSIMFIMFSVSVLMASLAYPVIPIRSGGSPGIYPQILAFMLILLSICLICKLVIEKKRFTAEDVETKVYLPEKRQIRSLVGVTVGLVLAPFLIMYLGFLGTMFIFLFIIMMLLTEEKKTIRFVVIRLIITVATIVAVYLVFQVGASVPFPFGSFFYN
ncbi:MAG TPA: tripartite tricarboxylate transporter TctB family protein [Synergistales bacterium]|nr:tripartite tricarboxylate transporter TctB family protein [Synergistales bacterium]